MSAPDTNVEKQEKRHRPSLFGIKGAIIFGILMLLGVVGFNLINAGDPDAVTNTDRATPTLQPEETPAPTE